MKAVILAGGLGTRMGEICYYLPKPLVEIQGKPILLHQIEALKKEGISDFIIVTGYLGEKIEEYFEDGNKFGVNIAYYREKTPLGTAGALFELELNEDFVLCNGDLIFDIDLSSMSDFHFANNSLATLFVHPNSHPEDSLSLAVDKDNRITRIYPKNKKAEFFHNICNAGIQIVSPELLALYSYSGKADFDKDIIFPAAETGRLFAYCSAEYVHDAGTPERLNKASEDIAKGVVSAKNKRKLQKAVFVDRDGTLNVHKGYITDPEDVELIEGVAQAINNLHDLGYLVIMISNQPVVARGECSFEMLDNIHCRLEMLLAESKAYLDGLYYCPHHPDKGFDGEVAQLKINCSCRKPAPALILQAAEDFNVDLDRSYMVGDSITDMQAGVNAGCTPIYVGESEVADCECFGSLKEFSDSLVENQRRSE